MKKLIAALLLVGICGCSSAQTRQEFFGLSLSDVKNSKTRQTQQYDISSDECLTKIKDTLKEMEAIVRENKKQSLILADNFQKVFHSTINTTQVGIVVTPWEKNKSQVDVASGNSDLAIFVSKKISDKIKPPIEAAPKAEAVKQEKTVVKPEDKNIK